MSRPALIERIEKKYLGTKSYPAFRIGDTISVHTRIVEGDKERIQIFTGTCIARSGIGSGETFSVHRIAYGEGMERVFPIYSPRIAKIELVKEGRIRRAKLYYLRGMQGKKARVKGRFGPRKATVTTQAVAE